MFTVLVGIENKYEMTNFNEALSFAVEMHRNGAECEIISNLTGEVLVILYDHKLPYIASGIKYVI